jgi:LacI family transcriptional regulator
VLIWKTNTQTFAQSFPFEKTFMANIIEVAKRAGVSPTTVSHVINKTRFVSVEVTERVLAAMEELGYQPNALARSLRRGETNTLGLILPDSANPYFAEIGRVIESEAFQRGYSVILCNSEDDPLKETIYADVLSKKQVDGMIFVATGDESDTVQTLLRQNLPLVLVDRQLPGVTADTVLTNNRQGGELAGDCLANAGHRKLGCITGPSHLTPSADRANGFLDVLGEHGIPAGNVKMVKGDFHPQSGYQAGLQMLSDADRPTAVFCCNDMMAIGLYRSAAELGLHIPDDLAVLGFDDIDLSSYINPPLSTIAQPKSDIGKASVTMLVERIADRNMPFRRQVFDTSLVIRQSCSAGQFEVPRS